MDNGNICKIAEELQYVNSETASVALFLAETYKITGNSTYLKSAEMAASFLENEIMPTRKWFDFETFVSCSQKPFAFYDSYTRQYPENNLAKFPVNRIKIIKINFFGGNVVFVSL